MVISASTIIKTKFGDFNVYYHEFDKEFCISFSKGDLSKNIPIIRIHSACLFGESFHSLHCDCSNQIKDTMKLINKNKSGVIVYSYKEGRGIGLKNKIKAMEIERIDKIDTIEAFKKLGFNADPRDYINEVKALNDLKINKKIKIFSGNPNKITALTEEGYTIVDIIHEQKSNLSDIAKKEIDVKIKKLGYKY